MKNVFKFGALAIIIAATFAACDPQTKAKSTETPVDSPKAKIDTPAKAGIDTAKKDTTKK